MTTVTDAPASPTAPQGAMSGVQLAVEYWTVTMGEQASCGSCDDTLTVVNRALDATRPLAEQLGVAVDLVPRTVGTWAEAVDHGIVASPTLRAAGIELRPSHPDGSETRVWHWRGTTTASATPEALLDFLVQALAVRSAQLGDYLTRGGPAQYVRQFLHADRALDSTPTARAAASGACGCGPSTSG